jgi:hypothetical protein
MSLKIWPRVGPLSKNKRLFNIECGILKTWQTGDSLFASIWIKLVEFQSFLKVKTKNL